MINGTDHKGSTCNIGRILAEKLSDADNISEIFLPRDFSDFCCGCTCCFSKSEEKMFSKQAAVITTAAGAGMKSAVSPDMKISIDSALEKIAGIIKSRYGNVPVPLKTRSFFRIMSLMQKNGWNKADMDYWNTMGWTGKKRPWN